MRGDNTTLFDNPNATSLGDQDLIKELTRYIELNPYYPLPPGYKKMEERYTVEHYRVPNYFDLPESTKVVTEILDEFLSTVVGIHVIEPISTYESRTKIIPTIGKAYQRDPAAKMFMLPLNKVPRKEVLEPVKQRTSLKELNTAIIQPKLTSTMKLHIAKAPKHLKNFVKEVAEVVAEIVQAVEDGRSSIGNRMKWGPSIIENKAIKDKIYRKTTEETMNQEKETQRKLRAATLKTMMEEMKKEKEVKKQAELEMQYANFN